MRSLGIAKRYRVEGVKAVAGVNLRRQWRRLGNAPRTRDKSMGPWECRTRDIS